MRIFCSLGALLAMLVIAFLLGLAVGTQMTGNVVPTAPSHDLTISR